MNFHHICKHLPLAVTRQLLQQHMNLVAKICGIDNFKSSIGYIDRFLKQNNVHWSLMLHGSGVVPLLQNYEERITRSD